MNIGICFGRYYPLHQDYIDLIKRAKKENDFTFVVVSDHDSEPYASKLAEAIVVNDIEFDIDEYVSEKNWEIWIGDIYEKIWEAFDYRDIKAKVTWYVTENRYIDKIHNVIPEDRVVLMNRTESML